MTHASASAEPIFRGLARGEAGDSFALRARADCSEALSHALSIGLSLIGVEREAPAPRPIAPLSGSNEERGFAALMQARAALLTFNAEAAMLAHAALDASALDDAWRVRCDIVAGYAAILGTGSASERCRLGEHVQRAGDEAKRLGLAHERIEASALASLLMLDDDPRRGIAGARVASRMARTEGLPLPEYLTGVLLARARRHGGAPHLASHILGAVLSFTPPSWHALIELEALLGSGLLERSTPSPRGPAEALMNALDAAASGDRASWRSEIANARRALDGAAVYREEIDDVSALVDPGVALDLVPSGSPASRGLVDFVRGASALPPRGLHALGAARRIAGGRAHERDVAGDGDVEKAAELSMDPGPFAMVHVSPDRPPRRLLTIGASLATGALPKRGERKPQERTDSALCLLAFADDMSLGLDHFFTEVYGFSYRPHLHKTVLDALVLRMRASLDHVAVLHRAERTLRLEVKRPFLLPDPRCAEPLSDRLLHLVGRTGPKSAKDAAVALNVPLRTVQAALKDLTESGSCVSRRTGKSIEYAVEDTTFSEPTQRMPAQFER